LADPYGVAGSPGMVRLRGEIDLVAAPHVRDAILSTEVTDGQREVIIDVAEVTFMDSSGISGIVSARRALQAQGTALWLDNPTEALQRVLALVGLDGLLLRQATPVD